MNVAVILLNGMTEIRLSFSLATLIWLTVCVAALLAGLSLPSPFRNTGNVPVAIATRNLDYRTELSLNDYEIRNIPAEFAPPDAASHSSQLENHILTARIRTGCPIILSDVHLSSFVGNINIPPGYKVLNVRIDESVDDVTFHLLKAGDHIALETVSARVLDNVRVFNVNKSPRIVGILVNEAAARLVVDAKRESATFLIGTPVDAE